MNRNRLLTVFACLLIVGALAAPAPAMAQSDDESDDDEGLADAMLGTVAGVLEDPLGAGKAFLSAADGAIDNALYRASWGDPERTPAECADALRTEVNDHNQTYEQYINDRATASSGRNVVKVTCNLETDDDEMESDSIYLVATVNSTSGDYEGLEAVDSTDRTVDHEVRLYGLATEEMPDDLVAFREEYAAENETPGGDYKKRMTSKYAGHVYGSFEFLPDGED